jgi:hypothetical protein
VRTTLLAAAVLAHADHTLAVIREGDDLDLEAPPRDPVDPDVGDAVALLVQLAPAVHEDVHGDDPAAGRLVDVPAELAPVLAQACVRYVKRAAVAVAVVTVTVTVAVAAAATAAATAAAARPGRVDRVDRPGRSL